MFNIKKTIREIYKATKVSDDKKSLLDYEFTKTKNGWLVIKESHNIDYGIQDRSEMWIPDEIIEKIVMEHLAQDHLLDKDNVRD